MSIGHFTDEAQAGLRAAAAGMGGRAAPHLDEALGIVLARRDVYRGLVRLTDLLTGARPLRDGMTLADADPVLRQHGNHVQRLRFGLHAAGQLHRPYPPAGEPGTPTEQAMRRAADAVGAIGDILASHMHPGRAPRTPEGAAVRAGGGVSAALADVARLTRSLLAVDAKLPGWLGRAEPAGVDRFAPVAEAARWASGNRLRAVAHQVIEAGADTEPLLRLLEPAPAVSDAAAAVTTAEEATGALTSARTWLWQHPDQVQFAHFRLAAQLGLAVHTAAGEHVTGAPVTHLRAWREAAIAVADLHGGAPTVGAGRAAASDLAEVLRWTREQLSPGAGEPAGRRGAQAARLLGDLPLLAEALRRGVAGAVGRGEFFSSEPQLHRPEGKLLFYARAVWTPITQPTAATRALTSALQDPAPKNHADVLESLPARARPPRAAQAFPGPLRTTTAPPSSPSRPTDGGAPGQIAGRGGPRGR